MKTMKKFKKLVCAAITAAMVMSIAMVPALADTSDYAITVENSVGGSTYSAYKIFDASGSGDTVSYTIDSSSAWYNAVSTSSLFTLTQSGSSSTYYVATTANDEDVIAFLNSTYETIASDLTAAATEDGTGSSITLDVGEAGYYYVTTTTGATASITTALPSATIMDKNQTPGKGGSDPNDPDWDGSFSKDADEGNYSIGDTIEYEIKTYAPTYDGTSKIYSYTITDTMGEGLTYDDDVVVKLIGSGLTDYVDITDQCTIECKDGVLTITWSPLDIENYPSDAVITIDYTDTVNDAADATDVTNDVHMTWYKVKAGTEEDPEPDTENPGSTDTNSDPSVTVYTYGFDLKKINKDSEVLEGAQFSLADADGNLITFLYDTASDTYEVWDGITEGETTQTITVADGELNVWGLAAGTYTLTELVAPDGYNLLTSPVTITISETNNGWTVTANGTSSNGVITGDGNPDSHGIIAMPTITVVNASGTVLPGTGGMGTALIIIIGCAIVAGAVAVVASRRRKVA